MLQQPAFLLSLAYGWVELAARDPITPLCLHAAAACCQLCQENPACNIYDWCNVQAERWALTRRPRKQAALMHCITRTHLGCREAAFILCLYVQLCQQPCHREGVRSGIYSLPPWILLAGI